MSTKSSAYRREIDGLRAIAVLPVILFHAEFTAFPGGFVGVDVFYVISGYLITAILLKELRDEKFSIVKFYERRARRILPALFVVLAACIPFAYLWMLPNEFAAFWRSVVAVATFTSNFHFWRTTDYFAPSADNELLLHTWSLAVEEQFYLLFPIYLFLVWRFCRSWLVVVTAAAAIASFALAEWGWRNVPIANFYLLPGRGWELLAGALVAFWHREGLPKLPSWLRQAAPAAGLGAILWSVFGLEGSTATPAYLMAVPTAGASMVIAFADGRDVTSRLLSLGPFVFVGLISYSAYLWHQPIFALLRMRSFGEVSVEAWIMAIAMCLGLAAATWRYVEQPFRARSGTAPLVPRAAVFASSIGGLIALGFGGYVAAHSMRAQDTLVREGVEGGCYRAMRIEDCATTGAQRAIVLWGDSYADAFAPALIDAAKDAAIDVYPRIFHSCPSLLGVHRNEAYRQGRRFAPSCAAYTTATKSFLESLRPQVVVISSAYAYYVETVNPITRQPVLLSDSHPNRDGLETVLASLEETVRFLNGIGAKVVLVPPHPVMLDFSAARRRVMLGATANAFEVDPSSSRQLTNQIGERLRGLELNVVSADDLFCHTNPPTPDVTSATATCAVIDRDGKHLTFDGAHLSPLAAKRLANSIVAGIVAGWR